MLRVLTTLYNALPFIGTCLSTITQQSVRDWRCYVLNDLSTDGSERLAAAFAERDDRIIVVNQAHKLHQVGGYAQVLSRPEIAEDDICITVDGDDWLPDRLVFQRVVEAYADPRTWLTWGSMLFYDGRAVTPSDLSRPLALWHDLRGQAWVTSHLRTWKAFLFRAIEPRHLRDSAGQYWTMAGDQAFMLPMLEMAGPEHARFLADPNYVYNGVNPLSDHNADGAAQARIAKAIRQLPPYRRLDRM
jgi:glycosyltransferase involved in cell wall biosynthesis